MYAKCGDLQKAIEASFKILTTLIIIDNLHIFEGYRSQLMPGHSATVTWTAIMQAHSINGKNHKVLQLFEEMQRSGVAPNEFTYLYILSAMTNLNEACTIHAQLMVSLFLY